MTAELNVMVRGFEELRKTHGRGFPRSDNAGHERSYIRHPFVLFHVGVCAFAKVILFDLFRLFSLDKRQEYEKSAKQLGTGQHHRDLFKILWMGVDVGKWGCVIK
jgi:hypothetical protein